MNRDLATLQTFTEEWGYRDKRDGGTIGPVSEQQAREAVAAIADLALVRRVVRVTEWMKA